MVTNARRGSAAGLLPALLCCCTLLGSRVTAAPPAADTPANFDTAFDSTGLSLVKTVDRPTAAPGDVLTYTLYYFNNGSATAGGVMVFDPLPPGMQLVDASAGGTLTGGYVVWPSGDLLPGGGEVVSFRAQVTSAIAPGMAISNQAFLATSDKGIALASNSVTTTIGGAVVGVGFTGTYKLIVNAVNPTSITVDPQNRFTVASAPGDRLTLGEGAQGVLNPDGSFAAPGVNGRAWFYGQVDPISQTASVTVQRGAYPTYSVVLPRVPDFNPVPGPFTGTFAGSALNSAGDRLQVLLTIDPGGNSTFQGDLTPAFPVLQYRSGSYQVSSNGALGFGGQNDGFLQPLGSNLLLTYNWISDNYQSSFQVPLYRR